MRTGAGRLLIVCALVGTGCASVGAFDGAYRMHAPRVPTAYKVSSSTRQRISLLRPRGGLTHGASAGNIVSGAGHSYATCEHRREREE